MVILFAEIESLRKRVTDKEKEVEDVRRRSLSPNILWSFYHNSSLIVVAYCQFQDNSVDLINVRKNYPHDQ